MVLAQRNCWKLSNRVEICAAVIRQLFCNARARDDRAHSAVTGLMFLPIFGLVLKKKKNMMTKMRKSLIRVKRRRCVWTHRLFLWLEKGP